MTREASAGPPALGEAPANQPNAQQHKSLFILQYVWHLVLLELRLAVPTLWLPLLRSAELSCLQLLRTTKNYSLDLQLLRSLA